MNQENQLKHPEFWVYKTEDGAVKVHATLKDETIWLSQKQLSELYQTTVANINIHIRNVLAEGELEPEAVIKDFLITASDGKSYHTMHYNLDMIISVGYRIKSHLATRFRIWATQRLKEYLVKGFTMNDEVLKQAGARVAQLNNMLVIYARQDSECTAFNDCISVKSTTVEG